MSEVNNSTPATAGLQTPDPSNITVMIEPATPTVTEKDETEGFREVGKTDDLEQTGSVNEEKEMQDDETSERMSNLASDTTPINLNNNEDNKDIEKTSENSPTVVAGNDGETSTDQSQSKQDDSTGNSMEYPSADQGSCEGDERIQQQESGAADTSNNGENAGKCESEVESEVESTLHESRDTSLAETTLASSEHSETKPNLVGETTSEVQMKEKDKSEDVMETDGSMVAQENQTSFQVTTDIDTEHMEEARKDQGAASECSAEDKERIVKTPESIAVSVDLPVNAPVGNISRLGSGRPLTGESEFVYNEHDFPTPDYEMYGPTPTVVETEKGGQLSSPAKFEKTSSSRAEGTKSVTFADDVNIEGNKETDKEDKQRQQTADEEGKSEETQEKEKTEGDEEQIDVKEETKEEGKQDEAAADIFPTAVSEEKLEEAKRRQSQGFTKKEGLAIELFGASKFVPESLEDVVTKKAYEHFENGCKLMEKGDFSRAVLSFDKALNLLPKTVQFYLMRGEAYFQLCDFQSAILNMKKACVLQPDNNDYYSRLAFVYYFQGQILFDQCLFAEALESFSRAAEMRSDIIAYHTRSIACLAALQRHGECLALVNKRLETEKSNPDLYIMRARLHQLFRNTTLCYYDLKDALALDPTQEEAIRQMQELEVNAEENRNNATRLQLQGKFKDSLTKITIAIEMNPSVSQYHLQRGALQRRLHDYNAAIDDFLLAMDKTEHNEHDRVYTDAQRQLLLTYNDFAVECFLGSHFEEAILLLNKALKGEKREKGLYINRGDCFFRLQEYHFALADYHQASEIDPLDPAIRSRVAAIHSQFGLQDYEEHSYQEAESRFTVAIQHNPRHGPYYIARCKVRLMLENQNGARQDFLMALHLDPSNIEILTLMPRLYPGKSVGDVMRTRPAKEAKMAAENLVVTASPVKLPGLDSSSPEGQGLAAVGDDGRKKVTFGAVIPEEEDAIVPSLKYCMDEIEFNKVLTKQKKKISTQVKSLLNDRGSFPKDLPKLKPQPPSRPYEVRGGHWKNPEPAIKPGWKTFSLGIGLME
ncbi:uncharacterized protein [Diadema antillarum]|uniref:uncharacterized protein n=1 Tax=Diadema antillarum TaxID=105358 RepID=UPI003A885562